MPLLSELSMTPDEASKRIADAQRRVAAAQLQIEGVRKFFDAALMVHDQAGAEKYRAQMHALLDIVLDSTAVIYSIIQNSAKL